jgi:hypothetical protein
LWPPPQVCDSLAERCASGGKGECARLWEESVPVPYYDSVLSLLYVRQRIEELEEESEEDTELDPAEFTLARKRWPVR